MRSPCNWIGNKYKYMENINNLVKGKEYGRVYDIFMGSGNILLNLECFAEDYIGNDNIPLIPRLLS